jgi:hypothetical protein
MKQIVKDQVTGHYKIGFAEQFYTLWWVTEKEFATAYTFMKNISKSRERVEELYPGIELDEKLRGKRGSFYTSNGYQGLFERMENAPTFQPHEGEITIEHLNVIDMFFMYSKWGKLYLSAECINLDRPDFTYIINDFDGSVLSNVAVGDIVKVTGNVGFVHDFKYYLNDVTISGIERVIPKYENGQKINENLTVTSSTSSMLQLRSDNGRYFFVPLQQRDFRTGRIVNKHMEIRDNFKIGNRLNVRATVKDVNGFGQLNYFKCSVSEVADETETPKHVQFIYFKMDEEMGRGRKRETVTQEYILCESDINDIAKKIFDINEQCQFKMFKNVDEVVEKINTQCIERALTEYGDMKHYTMRFDMCDCRRERECDRNFRFYFTCVVK